MGGDEEGTLAALKAIRKALVDPAISEHRGRIVKTTGDGLLVEFASAVDAARCAVAVQHNVAQQNSDVPPQRRIEFRIGIHVGDIIIDDNDIFGDGVNIAARLEGIAEPGGVCISDDAQRQIRGKVDVAYDDMGPQTLKNIAEAMRAWRLRIEQALAATAQAKPPAEVVPALALPDKPSIAVLPFQNMSGDAEQEYIADGMAEDIITALSRFKSLFVIARNSSFTYKGKAVDIKQVGRELGVRYVLEGSVRKSGGRVRITGQLIEAATGAHLWADKIDGALENVFDLQDEITTRVVGAIEPSITQAEINRAQVKPTHNLDAYDLYLKALSVHYSQTRTDVEHALRLLDQAIALDPSYSWAKAFASYIHVLQLTQGWVRREDLKDAGALAREALLASRDDPNTLGYAAHALAWLAREYEVPIACMDRALQLNPNSANILLRSGHLRAWVSDADRAIDHFLRSIRLSPVDPQLGYHYIGLSVAHVIKGEHEKALEYARRGAREMPRWVGSWSQIAVAAAHGGHQEEANAAAKRLLALSPNYTIALRSSNSGYRDRWLDERYEKGLRLAGIPEG